MGKEALKDRIAAAGKKADANIARMRDEDLTQEEFAVLTRQVVLDKFLLEESDAATDDILELADASVEKMLYEHDSSVVAGYESANCTGVGSVATKKVLLIMKLQRELGIGSIPPDVAVKLTTTRALADELYARLQKKRGA